MDGICVLQKSPDRKGNHSVQDRVHLYFRPASLHQLLLCIIVPKHVIICEVELPSLESSSYVGKIKRQGQFPVNFSDIRTENIEITFLQLF